MGQYIVPQKWWEEAARTGARLPDHSLCACTFLLRYQNPLFSKPPPPWSLPLTSVWMWPLCFLNSHSLCLYLPFYCKSLSFLYIVVIRVHVRFSILHDSLKEGTQRYFCKKVKGGVTYTIAYDSSCVSGNHALNLCLANFPGISLYVFLPSPFQQALTLLDSLSTTVETTSAPYCCLQSLWKSVFRWSSEATPIPTPIPSSSSKHSPQTMGLWLQKKESQWVEISPQIIAFPSCTNLEVGTWFFNFYTSTSTPMQPLTFSSVWNPLD